MTKFLLVMALVLVATPSAADGGASNSIEASLAAIPDARVWRQSGTLHQYDLEGLQWRRQRIIQAVAAMRTHGAYLREMMYRRIT